MKMNARGRRERLGTPPRKERAPVRARDVWIFQRIARPRLSPAARLEREVNGRRGRSASRGRRLHGKRDGGKARGAEGNGEKSRPCGQAFKGRGRQGRRRDAAQVQPVAGFGGPQLRSAARRLPDARAARGVLTAVLVLSVLMRGGSVMSARGMTGRLMGFGRGLLHARHVLRMLRACRGDARKREAPEHHEEQRKEKAERPGHDPCGKNGLRRLCRPHGPGTPPL